VSALDPAGLAPRSTVRCANAAEASSGAGAAHAVSRAFIPTPYDRARGTHVGGS
jgi:hypothetical protein